MKNREFVSNRKHGGKNFWTKLHKKYLRKYPRWGYNDDGIFCFRWLVKAIESIKVANLSEGLSIYWPSRLLVMMFLEIEEMVWNEASFAKGVKPRVFRACFLMRLRIGFSMDQNMLVLSSFNDYKFSFCNMHITDGKMRNNW